MTSGSLPYRPASALPAGRAGRSPPVTFASFGEVARLRERGPRSLLKTYPLKRSRGRLSVEKFHFQTNAQGPITGMGQEDTVEIDVPASMLRLSILTRIEMRRSENDAN